MKNITMSFLFCCFLIFISCSNANVSQKENMPKEWPTIDVNEGTARAYYNNNIDKLDPIEGIYSVKIQVLGSTRVFSSEINYRIAIIKSSVFPNIADPVYEYVAIVLETNLQNWLAGRVKGYIRNTAYKGLYEFKWFKQNYSNKTLQFSTEQNGILSCQEKDTENFSNLTVQTDLIRAYPLFK